MNTASRSRGPLWFSGLYAYIFCLLLSRYLLGSPIVGGALYMCGHLSFSILPGFSGVLQARMGRRSAWLTRAALILLLVCNMALLLLSPPPANPAGLWILFALILSIALSRWIGQRQVSLFARRMIDRHHFILRFYGLHTAFLLFGLLLLLRTDTGWMALIGLVQCFLMDIYAQLQEVREPMPEPPDPQELPIDIRSVHSLRSWEWIRSLIIAAMQISTILIYTFLVATAEQMLIAMAIALGVTLLEREITRLFLRLRSRRGQYDISNRLLVGLFLWLYGLILFNRMLPRSGSGDLASVCFILTVVSAGTTITFHSLTRMDDVMRKAACFADGSGMESRFRIVQLLDTDLATMLSQLAVLAALTVLHLLNGPAGQDLSRFTVQLQPIMAVPALLLLLFTFLVAVRFPVNNRYIRKLDRVLNLRESGGSNPALEKQLESVLVGRHHRPLGTQIIFALLRPFMRHKLIHSEKIIRDESDPVVYLCNHGEYYGPIACVLCLPVNIRPWSMSELVDDRREMAEYVYKYTFSRQKWLPKPLQMPVSRFWGVVSVWLMKQIESIPVYRNKPNKLVKTMRLSVEALQAGDHLLIFPENPDAPTPGAGYVSDGVGPLFSGFAVLSQMYYKKTGRICRYVPMYASKRNRTISFGDPILYNPDNTDEAAERERISAAVYEAINALYHEAEPDR